jgi:hypothetical protein
MRVENQTINRVWEDSSLCQETSTKNAIQEFHLCTLLLLLFIRWELPSEKICFSILSSPLLHFPRSRKNIPPRRRLCCFNWQENINLRAKENSLSVNCLKAASPSWNNTYKGKSRDLPPLLYGPKHGSQAVWRLFSIHAIRKSLNYFL